MHWLKRRPNSVKINQELNDKIWAEIEKIVYHRIDLFTHSHFRSAACCIQIISVISAVLFTWNIFKIYLPA